MKQNITKDKPLPNPSGKQIQPLNWPECIKLGKKNEI